MEGIELTGKIVQWSDLEITILRTKGHFWPASKEELWTMGLLLLRRRRHHHHHQTWQNIRCYGKTRITKQVLYFVLHSVRLNAIWAIFDVADLFSYKRWQLLEPLGVPKKNCRRSQITAGVRPRLFALPNLNFQRPQITAGVRPRLSALPNLNFQRPQITAGVRPRHPRCSTWTSRGHKLRQV